MSGLDVSAGKLIAAMAGELKKKPELKAPSWVGSVKSGSHAERLPESKDFWYTRVASLLRTLYVKGNVGVRRLRHKYGGKKEHRVSRAHHVRAGGKLIRHGFQVLEKIGFVKKEKAGRVLTSAGRAFVDKTANALAK